MFIKCIGPNKKNDKPKNNAEIEQITIHNDIKYEATTKNGNLKFVNGSVQ